MSLTAWASADRAETAFSESLFGDAGRAVSTPEAAVTSTAGGRHQGGVRMPAPTLSLGHDPLSGAQANLLRSLWSSGLNYNQTRSVLDRFWAPTHRHAEDFPSPIEQVRQVGRWSAEDAVEVGRLADLVGLPPRWPRDPVAAVVLVVAQQTVDSTWDAYSRLVAPVDGIRFDELRTKLRVSGIVAAIEPGAVRWHVIMGRSVEEVADHLHHTDQPSFVAAAAAAMFPHWLSRLA